MNNQMLSKRSILSIFSLLSCSAIQANVMWKHVVNDITKTKILTSEFSSMVTKQNITTTDFCLTAGTEKKQIKPYSLQYYVQYYYWNSQVNPIIMLSKHKIWYYTVTINGESLAGINFYSFCGFLEAHKSFFPWIFCSKYNI